MVYFTVCEISCFTVHLKAYRQLYHYMVCFTVFEILPSSLSWSLSVTSGYFLHIAVLKNNKTWSANSSNPSNFTNCLPVEQSIPAYRQEYSNTCLSNLVFNFSLRIWNKIQVITVKLARKTNSEDDRTTPHKIPLLALPLDGLLGESITRYANTIYKVSLRGTKHNRKRTGGKSFVVSDWKWSLKGCLSNMFHCSLSYLYSVQTYN